VSPTSRLGSTVVIQPGQGPHTVALTVEIHDDDTVVAERLVL
jgi:hypothetical protein